jgi:anti-sigma factor RsiW
MSVKPITEDDLHGFVDGALDETREAEVSAYLETHPEIAARIDSYGRQRLDLRAALNPVADEPVPSRLNLSHLMEVRKQGRLPVWRMAAAAVVLLVAGGSVGWMLHGMYRQPGEGMVALANEATDSFATYASDRMRPVEIRADNMAELVDWATARMGRKPILPDLSNSGYRLMGGRMISTAHGAGLMLMYDDDRGTRLVMLTRPMLVDQNRPMAPHEQGNVEGWSWASGGMGYSLVGALPADRLHPIADDIRQQTETGA